MNDETRRAIHEEAESARAGGRIMEIAPEKVLELLLEAQAQQDGLALLAARLTEVDAERLAIRGALQKVREAVVAGGWIVQLLRNIDVALATDSGRLVLAELEAARAVVVAVRSRDRGNIDQAMDDYDAAVKAREA